MISGELELDRLDDLGDEEVIAEIVAVRGLGQWTAEMFLMFHLERPDVLSGGDLGIRKAIQNEYGLEEMPTPTEVIEIGEAWRPHRSLASLYLWESLAAVPTRSGDESRLAVRWHANEIQRGCRRRRTRPAELRTAARESAPERAPG